ncbi:TRAP transporter small permease subunit [Alloalcanivorax mobilis]|jgi:TRAP-type mannitol/chloroaromatic compound transport system permease small subunit|uniref:TRAP transporter small permease subunit n=1 Tax=Alloalcanivorax mobilis TaxID=2019569 RepID=UPI000B5B11A9|nr:TRAP transporter small permease subunit [Alloalcanivorax mobilis]ASK36130.1 ABC transporter substrate-binding protein [Alcanivorax sp. N3-2A]|tara:strand:- start:1472 stop:2020 length:549 start_codon:yes stop_codon:yes gene_type:complete
MRVLSSFINGVTRLNDFLGRWFSYLILVIFALLILEVGLRYIMGAPTVWTNELSQLLFGVYAVMSGGYVMAHRGHVNVDLLYSHLSVRAQAWLDVFTSVLMFIFLFALLYFGISMAMESIQSLETSYSAWNPPIWPVKAALPIATALLTLQCLAKLLGDLAVALNLAKPEDVRLELEGDNEH